MKRLARWLQSWDFVVDSQSEPDFGLLDHLLSLEGLTRKQYNKLRTGVKAAYERSEELLDLLASKSDEDQCNKFLKALQRTGQQHVVNLITQNGGQNDDSNRPIYFNSCLKLLRQIYYGIYKCVIRLNMA